MLKCRVVSGLSLALLLVASSAFAGGEAKGTGGVVATPSLTWEQFKDSCQHPGQFHNQMPPANIKVLCTDISREFVLSDPGTIPLPGQRTVISSVISDKYHVNSEEKPGQLAGKSGTCLRFKEIQKKITLERKISCDDVLGIKSSLSEYCESGLDLMVKEVNPKMLEVKETGRIVDTCGPSGQNRTNGMY